MYWKESLSVINLRTPRHITLAYRLNFGAGDPLFEYRSLMDFTLAASIIRSDLRSALFSLPTELPDLFALFLVLTSSSVLGSVALTTALDDITEKMLIRERICLVLSTDTNK